MLLLKYIYKSIIVTLEVFLTKYAQNIVFGGPDKACVYDLPVLMHGHENLTQVI